MTKCTGVSCMDHGALPGSASRSSALVVSATCRVHATRALRAASALSSHSIEQYTHTWQ